MIISRTQVQSLLKDATCDKKVIEKKVKIPNRKDLNFAETGKAYQIAKKIINDMPEVREDRLVNVQQAIRTGTYSVSDEEIAEKMIARSLVDKLV